MTFSSVAVLVVTCLYASFSIHKGHYFKTWTADTKNGFHLGMAFAVMFVLIEYILSFLTEK